jgi:hypothetical protein
MIGFFLFFPSLLFLNSTPTHHHPRLVSDVTHAEELLL